MNKIKQFSHSVITHLWVFIMLQSGEQRGIQKNHYCDYILNHFTSALKRTRKIHRGVGYLQESFHAFAKAFLQTPPRCTLLTNTMSHLVLSQILSLICQRLPLPNPDLTPERTLGLPLALHMLTLPFPEVVLENL